MTRNFLFLQGVISPFFARMADALASHGHGIQHINFCCGDALYWRGRPAIPYRDGVDAFGTFLPSMLTRLGITDVVLFGDERPLHRVALQIARNLNLRAHVFEEGYLRPDWITLELDGVNANSRLPRDPAWYLEVARHLPQTGSIEPVGSHLRMRAAHDISYHLANLANPIRFPAYRTHRPYNAVVEYAGWARRFAALSMQARHDRTKLRDLVTDGEKFFLLPLQLNADAQITRHSAFADMAELIRKTVHSFALQAPPDSLLIIKNHPLDTGLVNYRRLIAGLQRQHALEGRVRYLESGDLATLLRHTLGVITVNSTVGLQALAHGCPTIALGDAVYALPGLTHQGPLDDFWQAPPTPDRSLFVAFRDTLAHTTQVNGGFYTARGIALAVDNCLPCLTGPSAFDSLPKPRLDATRDAKRQLTASLG
jgi:capsular polysaccharide export protein